MKKIIYFGMFGKQFKAKLKPDDRGGKDFIANYKLYEYRPDRKIFKWSRIFTDSFWMSETDGYLENFIRKAFKEYVDYEKIRRNNLKYF